VSTPLRWSEVGRRLDPRRFTIRSLHERLASQAEDPLRPVLTLRCDLGRALERLAARVERAAQSGG
jgi:DNA primase